MHNVKISCLILLSNLSALRKHDFSDWFRPAASEKQMRLIKSNPTINQSLKSPLLWTMTETTLNLPFMKGWGTSLSAMGLILLMRCLVVPCLCVWQGSLGLACRVSCYLEILHLLQITVKIPWSTSQPGFSCCEPSIFCLCTSLALLL